ncbi:TIGR02679 family protein [Microaerobacter geothermalis]|uniref:TIGR02679 family protein n=1 Tax=Microaerobacter geothermalis TaxID=674972 RepID=UPI001F2DC3F9|nr:TIGR02679 family protein [Microaerobacter geothermalis]MCF6094035.1 TIGR02679 family protein [Microaerobacter geothermalis]
MDHKVMEAVQYFQKEKGFQRLFHLFIQKYKGLGRIGGSVTLTNLTNQEREALSLFFRNDYSNQETVVISLAKFAKSLEHTKFAGVDFKQILDGYIGEELLSNQEEKSLYELQKQKFFMDLIADHSHPYCQLWLTSVIEKGTGSRGIHMAYDKDPSALRMQLTHVLQGISQLPQPDKRLSVFASQITGDPHGFDVDSEQGRFFITALQWIRHQEVGNPIISSPSAEEVTELLHYFGLIRDDLLNFVTCTGIIGFNGDLPIPMWVNAWENGNILNVPLREIVRVRDFLPANSQTMKSTPHVVFVIENSGVFSAVLDYLEEVQRHSRSLKFPPMICTHGQFKLAALLMLDKLVANGTTIFYSGDFDPEGLQMAQRLIDRYPGSVKMWRYGTEDYAKCISTVKLNDTRIKKLASISANELTGIRDLMIIHRKAGFQEELIDDLVKDLERGFHQ